MARGVGKVQRTLKALVAKEFARHPLGEEADGPKETRFIRAILGSAAFAVLLEALWCYLAVSGLVHMGAARVVLVFAWLVGTIGIIVSDYVWGRPFVHRIRLGVFASIALGLLLIGLDSWTVRHRPAEVHPISWADFPDYVATRIADAVYNRIAPLFSKTSTKPNAPSQSRKPDVVITPKSITEIPQGNLRKRALQLAAAIKGQVGQDGWPDRIFQQPGISKQKIEESTRYQSGYFRFRFLKDVIAIRDEFAEPFHLRDPALDEDLQKEATFEKADIPTDPRDIYAIAERLEALAQQK